MAHSVLKWALRLFNGERAVSSRSGSGTTGHSPAKEGNWTPTLLHVRS